MASSSSNAGGYLGCPGAMRSTASSEGLHAGVGGGSVAIWGSWGCQMHKKVSKIIVSMKKSNYIPFYACERAVRQMVMCSVMGSTQMKLVFRSSI